MAETTNSIPSEQVVHHNMPLHDVAIPILLTFVFLVCVVVWFITRRKTR